jgi:hypothetical protein
MLVALNVNKFMECAIYSVLCKATTLSWYVLEIKTTIVVMFSVVQKDLTDTHKTVCQLNRQLA